MTQADLAARTNLSTKHVNQIVQGVAPISHETALLLERATGTPARIWNALEAGYRDYLMRARHVKPSAQDEAWLRTLPVAELRRRGLLSTRALGGAALEEVLAFFGVADRAAWEKVWLRPTAAFRRSAAFRSDPGAVAAWLRIGELAARSIDTRPFDVKKFRTALIAARQLTSHDAFSDELVSLCTAAGVALVFVKEIPGCRTSGAARWLTASKALIQLSDRHKREDSFWFSFFHEGGHLLLHPKRDVFIEDGIRNDDAALEDQANQFAAHVLIPAQFAGRLASLGTTSEIKAFAKELGISPGVVVGRLHNDGIVDWNQGNDLIRKIQIVDD